MFGPTTGDKVVLHLDWERRYKLMRVHTALHLLSVVIPLPVTGGQIGAEKGRLDFDMPEMPGDKDALREADVIVCMDCIDINNVMGTYAIRRRSDILEAREKEPPKVIDMSLNAIDNNSWTAFGGPTPPVDLQIVCEILYARS